MHIIPYYTGIHTHINKIMIKHDLVQAIKL
jgi:hypothetical protein